VNDFLPDLYLAGLSLGDFDLFLREFLGDGAKLSPSHIARLKTKWEDEYRTWVKRPLSEAYAYVWADGVYLRVGLTSDRLAVLVVLGVTADGKKELLAVEPGYRESDANWKSVLGGLQERGLKQIGLIIGDGCRSLWNAAGEYYWETAQQLCWQHKIENVLGRLPDRLRKEARTDLRAIRKHSTRALAVKACIRFAAKYQQYEPAVETLLKDQERLLTFYDFPKAHWLSLQTTNPIESTFSPLRTRLIKTKRIINTYAALALVQQLLLAREVRLNRLARGYLAADVIAGAKYKDGVALDRRTRRGKYRAA
jgi:transposase-like protein